MTKSRDSWSKPICPPTTAPPSEWIEAATKPIKDYLLHLYSDEELKELKQCRTVSPFLELPREVRDEIYHHAWDNTMFGFWHESQLVLVRYGHLRLGNIVVKLPPWVHTSAQMLHEAMQQLHRCATFHLLGREQVSKKETWLPTFGDPSLQKLSMETDAGTMFPSISIVRCHHLSLAQAKRVAVTVVPLTDMCVVYYYSQRKVMNKLLFMALDTPRSEDAGLKELELTLSVADFFQPFDGDSDESLDPDATSWDFSLFDRIPRTLRRLKVNLYNYDCEQHQAVRELNCNGYEEKAHRECLKRVQGFMRRLSVDRGGTLKFTHGKLPSDDDGLKMWFFEAVIVHAGAPTVGVE